MIEFFEERLTHYGVTESWIPQLASIGAVVAVILITILVHFIAKKIVLRIIKAYLNRTATNWSQIILKNKVFETITHIFPAFVIHSFAMLFPTHQNWIQRIAVAYMIFIVLLTVSKILDIIDDIYRGYQVSKSKPIKGFLQVIKIVMYIMGFIVLISVFMDRSPWLLLSGIGAATAVLLLIFQNSILGLVAGIQLSTNNMIQVGDWIEMPKYGADGDVVEISLVTVKVQNWDLTITTIPTHALVSDAFKNWRNMEVVGGRRIKRSVFIDMTSVKFCDMEMLERFRKIQYIQQYINTKSQEIESYNHKHEVDLSSIVNGRHLTNLGTFRAYLVQYIENHPGIHKGIIRIVRQLDLTANGLPLELYFFTSDTGWIANEDIASDVFDHILAILPEFDLRVFQNPTGHDMRNMASQQPL